MATIISSNFYLTNTQMEDNAGLIGYQNLVTPSTISATSQISTNPITNAANPATAWGWIAGDQPAPADSISYTGTNSVSSAFNPSAWLGVGDPDVSYTSITEQNPSGESFVGEFEYVGPASMSIFQSNYQNFTAGETAFICFLFKPNPIKYMRLFLQKNVGGTATTEDLTTINGETGDFISGTTDPDEVIVEQLANGYYLVQVKYTVQDSLPYRGIVYCDGDFFFNPPDVGDKIKMQAAYFGKADDYPAVIATQGVIQDQTITINTAGQEVDYIGIAKHNLNQIGLTVTIKYNGITVVPAQSVSDKQALLFLNNIASPDTVEIIISGATSPPRIAVLYVGKALRLQRNIYVGHTPISYGRKRTAINGVSENGQYLGEIVVREMNMTSVNLQNLTPDWYRQNLDPFFGLSPRVPCFWAWRPSKYEDEVGYCWVEGDPQMSNQRSNGMVECSWNFKGIV